MTHRHFMTGILLAAFTITGIQASGGFASADLDDRPSLAQVDSAQDKTPAS